MNSTCSLINVKVVLCLHFSTCFFEVSLCQNNKSFETYNKNYFIFFLLFLISQHVFHRVLALLSPKIMMLGLSGLNVPAISSSFHVNSPPNSLTPSSPVIHLPRICTCIVPVFGFCCGQTKHQIRPKVTKYTFRLMQSLVALCKQIRMAPISMLFEAGSLSKFYVVFNCSLLLVFDLY